MHAYMLHAYADSSVLGVHGDPPVCGSGRHVRTDVAKITRMRMRARRRYVCRLRGGRPNLYYFCTCKRAHYKYSSFSRARVR